MISIRRRALVGAALASPLTRFAFAQPLTCGKQTAAQTEGPFFSPNSPKRVSLLEKNSPPPFVISGLVLGRDCKPVANALVDLWHADEQGEYDNTGFRYRGHQFTDAQGRYRFETIVPALYPGRTRHYHVKVQAPKRRILTTQLYFPNEAANKRDGIYRPELEMKVEKALGSFDFVVDA